MGTIALAVRLALSSVQVSRGELYWRTASGKTLEARALARKVKTCSTVPTSRVGFPSSSMRSPPAPRYIASIKRAFRSAAGKRNVRGSSSKEAQLRGGSGYCSVR